MIEAWKWKHGMIWQNCIQACCSGGMLRSVFRNHRPSILILLLDGTVQVTSHNSFSLSSRLINEETLVIKLVDNNANICVA